MSFLLEMLVPVLVLVVAPTQRPNPTEARPGHGDERFRLRRPLGGRPDSARPSPPRDFGQGLPPGAMGPHRSTRPPWPTTHSNAQTTSNIKKEGLQKGHAQVCTRPPAARKHTRLPRALAHNNARLCEALLYAVRWVSGGSARSHLRRRGASLRLASHHVHGHPATRQPAPARACPVPSAGIPLARASGHPLVSWGPLAPPGF